MYKGKNKMMTKESENVKMKSFFYPEKQLTIKAKNKEEADKKYNKLNK